MESSGKEVPPGKRKSRRKRAQLALLRYPLIGSIAVIAGFFVYLSHSAVTISVTNTGCGTLPVTIVPPVTTPGVSIPKIIPEGNSTITLPPLSGVIDATWDNRIRITTLRNVFPFEIRDGLRVTFDGMDIIGNFTSLNLGDQKVHDVTISCI